jgi:hypothetical protein
MNKVPSIVQILTAELLAIWGTSSFVGKLREMPRAAAIPAWKAYCGMEKLAAVPSGGRWVLEMQEP